MADARFQTGTSLMNADLDLLGRVVRDVGLPRFGQAFFSLFRSAFEMRWCSVFAFRTATAPYPVVSEGGVPDDSDMARRLAREYVDGGYQYDPNVCSRNVARVPAVYCLRADELAHADYRRQFYEEPRMSYELVQLSTMGDVLYYMSFYRDEHMGPFHAKDVIAMRKLSRFALPALQRHADLSVAASAQPPAPPRAKVSAAHKTAGILNHMREMFLDAPYGLSRREAEVCAGTILGYTTIAIGLNLQITPNTVATHRKRAYKKLRVCGQSELFARYFENVRQLQIAA